MYITTKKEICIIILQNSWPRCSQKPLFVFRKDRVMSLGIDYGL